MSAQKQQQSVNSSVGRFVRVIRSFLSDRRQSLAAVLIDPIPGRRTVGLLVGDLTVLALFIAIGLYEHNILVWEYPQYAVMTALPFVIAWLLVAPVLGAYATNTVVSIRQTVGVLVVVWTLASLLGGAIRATDVFHGGAQPIFLVVNLGLGLLMLLPWRVVATIALNRT